MGHDGGARWSQTQSKSVICPKSGHLAQMVRRIRLKDWVEKFDFLTTIAYMTVIMPFDQGWSRASKNMVTVK